MPSPIVAKTQPAFLHHFDALDDPRQQTKVLYPLDEVLLLVLCAVISGADIPKTPGNEGFGVNLSFLLLTLIRKPVPTFRV